MHLKITKKASRGVYPVYISQISCLKFRNKQPVKTMQNYRLRQPHSRLMPIPGLQNFPVGLGKTFIFLQQWRFRRPRSSKVIDFGTNRKRVCDFLLVRHSNLGLKPNFHYARFACVFAPSSRLFRVRSMLL